MIIVNQDRDIMVKMTHDSFLNCEKQEYIKKDGSVMLMGYNILYNNEVLLGTFDDIEDCNIIKEQILRFWRLGDNRYTIPEPSMDIEELLK